jgi:hypothetical protein
MQNLKKSTNRAKKPAIEDLTRLTISVFFLSILIIISFLVIIFIIFRQPDDNKNTWRTLLLEYVHNHPAAQPADIYKLIYQGTFGPAHLGSDSLKMLESLQNEIADINANPNSSPIEKITPSGIYVRLNLRYFKAVNGDPVKLVSAIIRSSSHSVDSSTIARRWKWVEAMVTEGEIPLDLTAFQAFSDSLEKAHYPVIHHSRQYIDAYHPAYRVIRSAFIKELIDQPVQK